MADPHFADVELLLNLADTGLTDQSQYNVTVTPNDSQSFSGGNIIFDGTNDYWDLPSADGTSDFTYELVFRFDSLSGVQVVFDATAGSPTDSFQWKLVGGVFQILVNGVVKHSFTPSNLTYYQIAWVRSGSTFYFFVDGALQGSAVTMSPNFNGTIRIGADASAANYYSGRVEAVRLTADARYTADYTAPDTPYPAYLATISGNVTDDTGTAVARAVRGYKRSDGSLLYNGGSDGSGNYSFNVKTADEVQVVVLDSADLSSPPQLNDKIIRVNPLGP